LRKEKKNINIALFAMVQMEKALKNNLLPGSKVSAEGILKDL